MLSLCALLSQPFVAFVVEFDNEFEHRTPHTTSRYGATGKGPWLVSMALWSHFMRFIPEDGIPVRQLPAALGADSKTAKLLLTRMSEWWGYVTVDAGGRVTPTRGGRKALEVWRPLAGMVEERWRERFGAETILRVREALEDAVAGFDASLPDFLPILGYGLVTATAAMPRPAPSRDEIRGLALPALLSKVLLRFANEFEKESQVSLAICANVLRLAGDAPVPIRDLPRMSGVSKEAIAMAVKYLDSQGYANVAARALALTARGEQARGKYFALVSAIEERWNRPALRESLERLQPLRVPEPWPDNWRAKVKPPEVLPHFPMVLHRGGFPDGS
jgi:hypothetical protein